METPRILKSPILVDEKRLQVGYKEDDIRAFLPRSVRNVEKCRSTFACSSINIKAGSNSQSYFNFKKKEERDEKNSSC